MIGRACTATIEVPNQDYDIRNAKSEAMIDKDVDAVIVHIGHVADTLYFWVSTTDGKIHRTTSKKIRLHWS